MNETKNEQVVEKSTQEENAQKAPGVEDPKVPAMRQVIIETDGNKIRISKNESASPLELRAILSAILSNL